MLKVSKSQSNPCLTDRAMQLRPSLDFSTVDSERKALAALETAYWDYVDNHVQRQPYRYPYVKLQTYCAEVLSVHGIECSDVDAKLKRFARYKKTIPTAGVVMHHVDLSGDVWFVVVQNNGAKLWSMPKGKVEAYDADLASTACREFREETGLDVSDVLDPGTAHKVMRTTFFTVASDCMPSVRRHRTREILRVKWVKARDVHGSGFSKQAVAVAAWLLGKK